MAYIGKSPIIGNFVKLDAITAVNGQAAYTMQNGGANFTDYETVNQFLVSLNGTIQAPTDSFTVSGSTLTFASNLSTGDVIDFIIVFGNSLSAGTPTDGTVTAAKLNNDIISGQTALGAEPADTDEFLVSDAGTIKRVDYSYIKGGVDGWSSNSGNLLPADASKGIYLGVNSATAANLLNDYEEGTWTPKLEGSSTSGSSPTGNGRYTKIGNLVHIDFSFVNKTISGAVGDLRIKELPFTISGADGVRGAFGGNVRFYNYDLDGNTYYQLTLVADENTTYCVVTQTRDHGTWDTLGVDNDSGLYVEGGITYTTTA
jgi:hypothetical protein